MIILACGNVYTERRFFNYENQAARVSVVWNEKFFFASLRELINKSRKKRRARAALVGKVLTQLSSTHILKKVPIKRREITEIITSEFNK